MAILMQSLLPRATKINIITENLRDIAEQTLFCNGTNGLSGYVQKLEWCVDDDLSISATELGSNSFLQDYSDVILSTKPEELDFLWEGVLEYNDDGDLVAVNDCDEDFIVRDDGSVIVYDTMQKCFEFQWSEYIWWQWQDLVEFLLDDVHVEPTHTYRLANVDVDILNDEKYDDLEYNTVSADDGSVVVYANAEITEWEA